MRRLVSVAAISLSLFHLLTGYVGPLPPVRQRAVHLGLILVIAFLLFPMRRQRPRLRRLTALDLGCVGLTLVTLGYLFWNFEAIALRLGISPLIDLVFGAAAVLLVLEATRRVLGLALPAVAAASVAYAYFGPYLPGQLGHQGYDLERILSHLALETEGVFGIPLGVSSTFVALFVIFAAFLAEAGATGVLMETANAVVGGFRGAPAKLAVFGSALFGTISGSAVANAGSTGAVTIPMMKRCGFRGEFAAGVEAAASCGGQIMPPVMGAAAFLVAEFLDRPYVAVAVAASVPAVLYYASLFFLVDFESARLGLRGTGRGSLSALGAVLVRGAPALIPIVVLLVTLIGIQYTAAKAAFLSIATLVLLSLWSRPLSGFATWLLGALKRGGLGLLQVALACACAGILIGMVSLTGIGLKLSEILIDVSGGRLLPLLVLTMLASIVLGTGLPTVPTYLLLAILVVPALVKIGVVPIAAHLFMFYYGALADLTPPLALSVYVAAGIAGADPLRASLVACRLAAVGFVVPFMFVLRPALLLEGSVESILTGVAAAAASVFALTVALGGHLRRPLSRTSRVVLGGAGLALTWPSLPVNLAAAVALASVVVRVSTGGKR